MNFNPLDPLTISKGREEWDKLTFGQRLNLVKLDCDTINEIPYIKKLGIISTPYVFNFRSIIKKKKKNSIKLAIYFHGDPDKPFDVNDISGIGECPVYYGIVKNKEKINVWKSQIKRLNGILHQ